MDVFMYLRKSRADNPESSVEETLRRHRDTLEKVAKERGYTVLHVYEEVVSGDSLYSRPQMLQMLEDVATGGCEAVLCMDLDRLGRGGMADQGVILETFKQSNTLIITPEKTYDLNNDIDEELTEFQTFMARRELKMIKRRLQRGIRKTIEEGGYIANAPYGYRKATVNKKPTLEINEEEARFVRMIFDMYVNQGIGCHTIAETLNAMGAKPHRAEKFGRTSIRHILKNPTFLGKIVWDQKHHIRKGTQNNAKHITIYNPPEKWTVVEGLHPAIIDEDTWNKAQAILKSRYHSPFFDGTVKNPLAGILHCAKCGSLMQRQPNLSRKDMEYILCPTKGCCASSRMDYVTDAVVQGIRKELDRLVNEKQHGIIKHSVDYSTAIKATEKELASAKSQKDKLHDLLEQGVYDTNTFMERRKKVSARIQELSDALEDLKKKKETQKAINYDKTIEKITTALNAFETADASKRNQLLKGIIHNATYLKEKGWSPHHFIVSVEIEPTYF